MRNTLGRFAIHHWLQTLFALTVLVVGSTPASAHSLGEGYLFIDVTDTSLSGWVEVTPTDLDEALSIDGNGDGKVSDDELQANLEQIRDYVFQRVGLGDGVRRYELTFTGHEQRNVDLSPYLLLKFTTTEMEIPDILHVEYRLLFEADPDHRGFLVINSNGKGPAVDTGEDVTLIFSPANARQDIDLTRLTAWFSFIDFLKHGIWHIWIGFDHILFLVALILPSVLYRRNTNWEPVTRFHQAFWNVIKIVTLFTIAHTITLTLATLGVVTLPGRLVEAVIAASVIAAALNNVYPLVNRHIGWVVFVFGLFHGFGFASVLQDLTTNATSLAADLAGFNIGVEIGQVAIIAVVFPLLYLLRNQRFYPQGLLPVGSAAIALFAFGWLIERVANLEFMPI